MATPHVAGVAALLRSLYPGASISELRTRVLSTAVPLASLNGRVATGGMVNAGEAMDVAADGILELAVAAPTLRGGEPGTLAIRVSDLAPVTGATVTAGFTGQPTTAFLDNGLAPDTSAADGVYTATLTAPEEGATVTLEVTASAPGKGNAQQDFELPLLIPPANDDFADRVALGPGTTTTGGTNRAATAETGEPRQPTVAGGKSLWWSWSPADQLETATISTNGSDFDTTLAVYTGTALSGLTLIAANDDSGGRQSSVTFTPVSGQE